MRPIKIHNDPSNCQAKIGPNNAMSYIDQAFGNKVFNWMLPATVSQIYKLTYTRTCIRARKVPFISAEDLCPFLSDWLFLPAVTLAKGSTAGQPDRPGFPSLPGDGPRVP